MSGKTALKVVLLWHMHQPEYRDLRTGQYHLPWTYLHAIKDYADMAAHLEAVPQAKVVVNFAPVLLEQILDYEQQIDAFLQHGAAIRDPLLEALVQPVHPDSPHQRLELIKQCLRANETRMIKRFPAYQRLADLAGYSLEHPEMSLYMHDQYLTDLLVWFHLAWLGESIRRSSDLIKRLEQKAHAFDMHDRRELLALIGDIIRDVIPRYRRLNESGQVELCMNPYAHPIGPLMLDFSCAREAMPDAPLPLSDKYPGGKKRLRWHLQKGLALFETQFGHTPKGCWPSEGGVSEAFLKMLDEFGFKWTATGESVLRNSLHASKLPADDVCVHHQYHHKKSKVGCFFRDDGLSDLIGFTYSDWHADDAVANLMHHLENIAGSCKHEEDTLVSIVLDGENAWEFYPENGHYFLSALYEQLVANPKIELTTYSDFLQQKPKPKTLSRLVAGSWVYGTFSTWIGMKEKNRGWDLLVEVKKQADRVLADDALDAETRHRIEEQLAICEGSDWFWWFGDYNPAETVNDFDYLYRRHLSNLYLMLGEEPPKHLAEHISQGSGAPAMGGVMRRGKE